MLTINDRFAESRYIPVMTEISGGYQLITGLFQRAWGIWMEESFGLSNPRPFEAIYYQQEGERNIDQGYEKIVPGVVALALIVLAIY